MSYLLLVIALSSLTSSCSSASSPCQGSKQSHVIELGNNGTAVVITGYTPGRPLLKFPGWGGSNGGSPFDDFALFNKSVRGRVIGISSIDIGYDMTRINGIQVTYLLSNRRLFKAPAHGSFSTYKYTIKLDTDSDEYISKVEVQTNGYFVYQLKITTLVRGYESRTYGPFGTASRYTYSAEGYILAFHGRSGDDLDNVGVYGLQVLKRSSLFGTQPAKTIAYPFDDHCDWPVPAIVGVSKINIWHGVNVNALQVEYYLLNGSTVMRRRSGVPPTSNYTVTTVSLSKGDQIVQFSGATVGIDSEHLYICQFSLVTRDRKGVCTTHGPFGMGGNKRVSFSAGDIYGFFGTTNGNICGIGMYYV